MHAYTYSLLNAATYWFRSDSVVRVLVLVLGIVLPPVLVRGLPALIPLGLRVLVLVLRALAVIVSQTTGTFCISNCACILLSVLVLLC